MAFGRTNTGGGGSGGTLVVNAPSGVAVTISKDGKTKTKTANAEGVAVFKGLETGTWAVMISDGQQTTAPVNVQVVADYEVTVAFFTATISVTYPSGSVCTCSKGSTVFTAPDTSGSWIATVPEAGDWIVSCTDGSSSSSRTIAITEDGQGESVALSYTITLFDYGNQEYAWQYRKTSFAGFGNTGGSSTEATNDDGSHTVSLIINSTKHQAAVYETAADIDLTGISTLSVEWGAYRNAGSVTVGLAVYDRSVTDPYNNGVAALSYGAITSTEGHITGTLDVSALSGSYAICVGVGGNMPNNGYASARVRLYKLEGLA